MSVIKGQARLLKIATLLEKNSALPDDYRVFLAAALKKISEGANAEEVLGVKAKRGERKGKHVRTTKYTLHFLYGWIAAAIQLPDEGGLGLSVTEACKEISEITFHQLRLSPQTFRRYWNKNKSKYKPSFQPPPAD
jgi:hypothetical protein